MTDRNLVNFMIVLKWLVTHPCTLHLFNPLLQFPVLIAQVVQPHAMDTGIGLIENEILFIIDQDEEDQWFVMTKEGLAGHVVRDYVELKPNPQEGMR